jgi:CRISPR/Cas system CSM-associated protein Csm3 (group 7 of RAMP superfamily)
MHKATFIEGTLHLTIRPDGPILIKAGETGGGDPALPDMEFVRTARGGSPQVYIPGPSLKGVVRAQAERICRSLDGNERQKNAQKQRVAAFGSDEPLLPLTDNPLGRSHQYSGSKDLMTFSSGEYFNELKRNEQNRAKENDNQRGLDTALIYRRTTFVSQLFGHTSLAGRVRFADAYSDDLRPEQIEERNGVAIDRIYGSVAVGPFNYETVIGGSFATRIDLKNITLAQLALLGLALRDMAEGRVALGFGKSRGLGRVGVAFDRLEFYYPTCTRDASHTLYTLQGRKVADANQLVGVGALSAASGDYKNYNFPPAEDERAPLAGVEQHGALSQDEIKQLGAGLYACDDEYLGVRLVAVGSDAVRTIWKACMPAWRREVGL